MAPSLNANFVQTVYQCQQLRFTPAKYNERRHEYKRIDLFEESSYKSTEILQKEGVEYERSGCLRSGDDQVWDIRKE
jgi:hypothetical protein